MSVDRVEFHNRPLLELDDSDRWVTKREFTATVFYKDGTKRLVVVPSEFSTDLASVPRLPLMWLMFGDRLKRAAILHDALYQTGEVSRKEADEIFFAAGASEAGWFTRAAMWLGVRAGGAGFFNKRQPPQGVEP